MGVTSGARLPVIFLGPSLPKAEASKLLDAEYRPPIKRGDIEALLPDPPAIVGVIDGQFFQQLSVSPKEILRALEGGIAVFGASSMGALRATELQRFGMIGVGRIFEQYRSGRLDADDEVAMIFAQEDHRPISEPLVNMRFALQGAVGEGIITVGERRMLLRRMKAVYFPQRSYAALLELARGPLDDSAWRDLRSYLRERAPDAKREDARLLLAEIGRRIGTERAESAIP